MIKNRYVSLLRTALVKSPLIARIKCGISSSHATATRRVFLLTAPVLLASWAISCASISGTSGDELLFSATEIGTPIGETKTKDIGPAGGTFESPDGRLKITVPEGALSGTVPFSIQPITNTSAGGIGNAYRLEPDGHTFARPLELSLRYEDKDLKGTVAEAFSVVYQDKKGSWHAPRRVKLDTESKTLTISTTHFTDYTFISRLRINPVEYTIRPGWGVNIQVIMCEEPGFWDKLLSRPMGCKPYKHGDFDWSLQGPGNLEHIDNERGEAVTYRAPPEKPTPNVATVWLNWQLHIWNDQTGETTLLKKSFASQITILAQGYRASGQAQGLAISGLICDMDHTFSLNTSSAYLQPFVFTPSSAQGGTVKFSYLGPVTGGGSGSYTVEGADGQKTGINFDMGVTTSAGGLSHQGNAKVHLTLTPVEGNDCGG